MAEHQAGLAVAGVAVQREPLDRDAVAGCRGQQPGLIGTRGELDEHVQPTRELVWPPSRQLPCQRLPEGWVAVRVAQAHTPQMAFEFAAGDEVCERELRGDLRARVLDRLGGDERPR